MFDLAQQQIIERAKNPEFAGPLENFDVTGEGENQNCGDEIRWEIQLEGEKITHALHSTRACSICRASADLLAETIQHRTISDVRALSTKDIEDLIGIPLSPTRLKCALLPLEAIKLALEQA